MIQVGNLNDMVMKSIHTFLQSNEDAQLFFYTISNLTEGIENLVDNSRIKVIELKEEDWLNKMMYCKIKTILNFYDELQEGDEVLVLDTDLIFKSDPFEVFSSNDFDVFVTSRHYYYHYSVNAGVWGFVKNKKTDKFILDFVNQITNPTYEPLLKFRQRFNRDDSLNWWVDQDYLCVVYEENLKNKNKNIELFDAGYRYNFCASTDILGIDRAVEEVRDALNSPHIKIIHLKADLKNYFVEMLK